MSIYAARTIIEATFNLTAINAAIDTLNTAWGTACPHLVAVADGHTVSPEQLGPGNYPGLLYLVPAAPAATEVPRTGLRDFDDLQCALMVVPRGGDIEGDRTQIDVMLEALNPLIDSLRAQALAGNTNWGVIDVVNLSADVVPSTQEGATIRLTGVWKFGLKVRRVGL